MTVNQKRLKRLRESILFSDTLHRRNWITHAEMAKRRKGSRPVWLSQPHVIDRVPDADAWVAIVRRLGLEKYAPAVPTLAELWRDCAVESVRNAAGYALYSIGSSAAREALLELIEDSDHLSVSLAVRVLFDGEPKAVFERCMPYFTEEQFAKPGGAAIPFHILSKLTEESFRVDEQPVWKENYASWLREEPRWIEMCIHLRRHPGIGGAACALLSTLDRATFEAALQTAPPLPEPPPARTAAIGDLLERYQRGEFVEVWQALRSFPEIGGDLRLEALEVARATMRRVVHNVDLLAERLRSRGWIPFGGQFRIPPQPADAAIVAEIERITGAPLPPGLAAFWEIVGGLDFVWDYTLGEDSPHLIEGDDSYFDGSDPLCIYPPGDVESSIERWNDEPRDVHPELMGTYTLSLSPDSLIKIEVSGGPEYGMELPFRGADPMFDCQPHSMPFVEYLRYCLARGGFALLALGKWPEVDALIAQLTKDFEPF